MSCCFGVIQSHTNSIATAWWTIAIRELNPSALEFSLNFTEGRSMRFRLAGFESQDSTGVNASRGSKFHLSDSEQISGSSHLFSRWLHFLLDPG